MNTGRKFCAVNLSVLTFLNTPFYQGQSFNSIVYVH